MCAAEQSMAYAYAHFPIRFIVQCARVMTMRNVFAISKVSFLVTDGWYVMKCAMAGVVAISLARRGVLAAGIKLLTSRAALRHVGAGGGGGEEDSEGCQPLSVRSPFFTSYFSMFLTVTTFVYCLLLIVNPLVECGAADAAALLEQHSARALGHAARLPGEMAPVSRPTRVHIH